MIALKPLIASLLMKALLMIGLAALPLAVTLSLTLPLADTALAHSKMSGSTPDKGETVAAGLDQFELRFDRKVRLTRVDLSRAPEDLDLDALTAQLTGDAQPEIEGLQAQALTSKLPKGFVDEASLSFESLPAGVYVLHWIAIAQDGHVMSGTVPFGVTAAAD